MEAEDAPPASLAVTVSVFDPRLSMTTLKVTFPEASELVCELMTRAPVPDVRVRVAGVKILTGLLFESNIVAETLNAVAAIWFAIALIVTELEKPGVIPKLFELAEIARPKLFVALAVRLSELSVLLMLNFVNDQLP